jgi:general secretion pathway protein G
MRRSKHFEHGFTLLELVLTLALAALLGAFAIPAYRGYVERVRESQAIADIGGLQLDLYNWELLNGAFPATLAAAGLDDLRDPWDQPYVYLNMALAGVNDVRKDKNLHPLNTDFDLYSIGPDGDSKLPLTAKASRDDILRANNGAFIGRAENYN